MERQVSNKEEFNKAIDNLGKLYEEAKDCLHEIMPIDGDGRAAHLRLFNLLQEMRDAAAVGLQKIHWINEN